MVIARLGQIFQALYKSALLQLLAVLLSLQQVGASPTQSQQVTRPRTAPNAVAAVPLPLHLGATAGSPGVYVPVQLVSGLQGTQSSAAGNLWTWVVAATGAAWHGVRQSHEPRPVRRSRDVHRNVVPNVNADHAGNAEEGWQTASEDEEEHVPHDFRHDTWQASPGHAHFQPNHFQPNLFQPNFSQVFPDGSMREMMQFQQASHMPQMLQPQIPQMMPVVMVPVPVSTESRDGAVPQPSSPGEGSFAVPGPVSPGRLDRHTSSALSEVSDWASVEQASLASTSSSVQRAPRWTNRDCDWAIRQLASGPNRNRELLQQILQDAWVLASSKHGTRVVQAAMDVAEAPEKQLLTNVFKGRVWYALKSPHANHVLQKIIALMPPDKMQFVFEELTGRVDEAARHPFGCRVLERLLEHCGAAQSDVLLDELMCDVPDLSRHPFGNYVIQHAFEHGSAGTRRKLSAALVSEAKRLARHKVASHVIECALVHAASEDRQLLKEALAENSEALQSLSASNYGSFVVKEMKRR